MALSDIIIETDIVIYNGQSFSLRGITSNDVKIILTRNRLSADMLFNLAERKGVNSVEDLTEAKLKEISQGAITELPVLVANIIAQCADDIDSADIVQRLPAPVQFDCLRKIARMTFSDATNFGEFLGNVKAAAEALKLLPQKLSKSGEPQPNVGMPA